MSVPSPKALRKLSSNAPKRYHESNTASVTRSRLKVFLIDRLFRMKHEATLPRTPMMAKMDCTIKSDISHSGHSYEVQRGPVKRSTFVQRKLTI